MEAHLQYKEVRLSCFISTVLFFLKTMIEVWIQRQNNINWRGKINYFLVFQPVKSTDWKRVCGCQLPGGFYRVNVGHFLQTLASQKAVAEHVEIELYFASLRWQWASLCLCRLSAFFSAWLGLLEEKDR